MALLLSSQMLAHLKWSDYGGFTAETIAIYRYMLEPNLGIGPS